MNMNFRRGCNAPGDNWHNRGVGADSAFCHDWRCQDCQRLLGKDDGAQMRIRRKPLDYVVGFPVYATCPNCGALNAKTKA